jgi:GWxTD domain-containing protein
MSFRKKVIQRKWSALFIGYWLFTASVFGQSLNSMNFNYCYDANNEIEFLVSPVLHEGKIQVLYQLTANRKEFPAETYSIVWQRREDFNDRNEEIIKGFDSIFYKSTQQVSGVFKLIASSEKWYLVAKVVNTSTQNTFHYARLMDNQWPVDQLVSVNGAAAFQNYASVGSTLKFSSDKKLCGYRYRENFTAALPPFAESKPGNPFLLADSSFSFSNAFTPRNAGLYLIQEDTTSARGVAILVTDANYPKYTRVALLAAPLVYITTDDEFLRLDAANVDKAAFDKVILEITNDKERAKNLMRSYFQRVELANRYFTEYKEGWKTDRGMLYIIYGRPDEVSRTPTGETWYYEGRKTRFEFKKSGSIFSPENYKLERDNRYMPEWFSMVDLWRKSRF